MKRELLIVLILMCVNPVTAGSVMVILRAGGSAQDTTVYFGSNTTPFDSMYHPDRTEIENQNVEFIKGTVLPDGRTELIDLDTGWWTVHIRNGNANQEEKLDFYVENGITYVSLLGAAVSPKVNHTKPDCVILEHTEYRFRDFVKGELQEVCHPEVSHEERITERQIETYTKAGWVITSPWEEGYCLDSCYGTKRCTERTTVRIVIDTPAYCEWVPVSEDHWTEWSDWSTDVPIVEVDREIESRIVPRQNICKGVSRSACVT